MSQLDSLSMEGSSEPKAWCVAPAASVSVPSEKPNEVRR
jgi:hypothetical protein